MFAVDEAAALAIRQACQDGGELSGVVELRRRFPGIIDNARARLCLQAIMSWAPPAPSPDQGPDAPGSDPASAPRLGRGGPPPARAGRRSGAPRSARTSRPAE